MPAVPPYIIEPIWEQFSALLPKRNVDHPLGCHRARIPDRLVFEKLVQVLVFGCAYEKIAGEGCSATTLRRRCDEWIGSGVVDALRDGARSLRPNHRPRALRRGRGLLHHRGALRRREGGQEPGGQGKAGHQTLRGRGREGHPLAVVSAPANRHDSPLLGRTLDGVLESVGGLPEEASVHLDRGYDSNVTRRLLEERGLLGVIWEKGKPAPLEAGLRWVVERTNSWHNAHKKLVWCTERRGKVIDFWIAFSDVIIIVRRLIREAWTRYRWETRPPRRP